MLPRKLLIVLLSSVLVLSSCHPSSTPTPQPSATVPPKKIALVMKTLTNPFFIKMEQGARRAEKEFGLNLIVKTANQETSIEQQIQIVESLIEEQVAAIVIAPGDSVELIPVLIKAQQAGIIVINIDNELDPLAAQKMGLKAVPYISVDNEKGAYEATRYITEQITTPETTVLLLEGIPSAKNSAARKAGALKAFQENHNITTILQDSANWKIDEGYQKTKYNFEKNPQIEAVFCANDMMALGAINYLHEVGRKDVLVAAFDNLDEIKTNLFEGCLQATVDQQADQQGYLGIFYAWQALQKKTIPQLTLVDYLLVTHQSINNNIHP